VAAERAEIASIPASIFGLIAVIPGMPSGAAFWAIARPDKYPALE